MRQMHVKLSQQRRLGSGDDFAPFLFLALPLPLWGAVFLESAHFIQF